MQLANQFGKFLLAGGVAAAANYGSRFVFSMFLPYVPSIGLAFLVGLTVGFLTMKTFVFSSATHASSKQASYYLLINLIGLALTIIVSVLVAKCLFRVYPDARTDEAIGHLVGVSAPVLLSFYAHKKFTFR
jgi:putative flippase GtrA